MAKGRRNKNKTETNMTNSSPNDRARKRGKKQQQSLEDEDMQDGSVVKRLFPDNASSQKANTSSNNNESDDEDFSLSTKEDSGAEELSQPSVDSDNQDTNHQKTDTDNNKNNNNNNEYNKLEKYDLASAPPPKMWTLPIASPNDFWTSLDTELYTDLTPFDPKELGNEEDPEPGTLAAIMEEGKELFPDETDNGNLTIAHWVQVIYSVFQDMTPALTHYAAMRKAVCRLALTDPTKLFSKTHWFGDKLSQVYKSHTLWIATYLTFGAPWRDRTHWHRPATAPKPAMKPAAKPATKPTSKPASPKLLVNPYQPKKTNEVTFIADTNDGHKNKKLRGSPKDPSTDTASTATPKHNSMYLRKPLKENPYKKQAVQKMKDYTRTHRTYLKVKLAQLTSEDFTAQETEVASSFKQVLTQVWSLDSTVIVLPWKRDEFHPIRKGSEFPRTKADLDKYAERIWMQKNKSPYLRILVAHNMERQQLFDDAVLQKWLSSLQLAMDIERIQSQKMSKAGHLLGYHAQVCNCKNLADSIQYHSLMKGFAIEVRAEFVSFDATNRLSKSDKEKSKTKTKILQIYTSWESCGKVRRALTRIYSSESNNEYPLGTHARFIPNITDLRFARPAQASLAYTNSLKKHVEFMKRTVMFSTENIIELDAAIDRYGISLRELIMHIFSASHTEWNLFVAVDTSYYGDCVHFAFREELQEEAMNMISALPLFLEATLGHSDVWNWFTQRARDEADDYEWDLNKGLVPKRDCHTNDQLTNWEHLDDLEGLLDENTTSILQPFSLDLGAFGTGTYTDDGTIKTSALMIANEKDKTNMDLDDVSQPDSQENLHSTSVSTIATVTTTTESQTTSTLTPSPDHALWLDYKDEPEFQAMMEKLRIRKLQDSSQAAKQTGLENAD